MGLQFFNGGDLEPAQVRGRRVPSSCWAVTEPGPAQDVTR